VNKQSEGEKMNNKYDIAAYVWPAFSGNDKRTKLFWPLGIGEWQSVMNSDKKENGYHWQRKPAWGYVNEADPCVMEMEIEAAVSHGVNVFIYDWYWYDDRPFLENCLNDGFLKAKNNQKMKFYIMWANHDATTVWDKRNSGNEQRVWSGRVCEASFKVIADRIINNYFIQPNYYCIDGKPVFMIYDIANFINGLGGMEKAKTALSRFREKVAESGFPGLHLQLAAWGEQTFNFSGVDGGDRILTNEIVRELGFDSITNYQFAHLTNIDREYTDVLKDVEKEWERIDKTYSVPYFPHVSVGWDNNPRFEGFRSGIMKNNTPENFEKALRMAKDYLDKNDCRTRLITVNSWNEWTESSYLQPDNVYEYGYLEAVKRVFMNIT
jgi:hypothetical protein